MGNQILTFLRVMIMAIKKKRNNSQVKNTCVCSIRSNILITCVCASKQSFKTDRTNTAHANVFTYKTIIMCKFETYTLVRIRF